MKEIYQYYDITYIQKIVSEDEDLIIIFWKLYEEIVDGFVNDQSWHNTWKAQTSLAKFHYSEFMRRKILKRVDELNHTLAKRPLDKPWSACFDNKKVSINF